MGNLVEGFAEYVELFKLLVLDGLLAALYGSIGLFIPAFLFVRTLEWLSDLASRIEDYILYFAYRDFVTHGNFMLDPRESGSKVEGKVEGIDDEGG